MIFRADERRRAGGRHVPAELPRPGPRRGAPHGGPPRRDRPGARPGAGGDSRSSPPSATAPRRCSWNPWRAPAADGVFRLPAAVRRRALRDRPAARQPAGLPAPDPATPAATSRQHQLPPNRHRPAHPRPPSCDRIRAAAQRAAPRPCRRRSPAHRRWSATLAELWAGLLNLPAVGIHDNFFELGGHSLLAVQLLSRVRQIYGVDLSLEVVYSGEFTVAELAKAVELKEIEQSGARLPGPAARAGRPLRRRGAGPARRRAGCLLAACASC